MSVLLGNLDRLIDTVFLAAVSLVVGLMRRSRHILKVAVERVFEHLVHVLFQRRLIPLYGQQEMTATVRR